MKFGLFDIWNRMRPLAKGVVIVLVASIAICALAISVERSVKEDGRAGPGRPDVTAGPVGGPGTGETQIDPSTQFLPPNLARRQLAIDPQAEPHRAHLSPLVQRSGMRLAALLKVCVDRDGNVVDTKMLTSVSSEVDAAFISAIRTWRYTPYVVAGRPVPFCTSVRYQLSAGS
jgi:hypothetical protein